MTKYVVGFMAAMQPSLVHEASFSSTCVVFYGAFSGVFLARAVRLWRLAFFAEKATVGSLNRV